MHSSSPGGQTNPGEHIKKLLQASRLLPFHSQSHRTKPPFNGEGCNTHQLHWEALQSHMTQGGDVSGPQRQRVRNYRQGGSFSLCKGAGLPLNTSLAFSKSCLHYSKDSCGPDAWVFAPWDVRELSDHSVRAPSIWLLGKLGSHSVETFWLL